MKTYYKSLPFYKRPFKILDRYLIWEMVAPFILAVAGFVIIGVVDILFTLIDLFVNSGVPFLVVIRLLIYKIPAVMVLFFPMAVLFAVMLTLVRVAKDNEITIFRSGGISTLRLIVPLLFVAAIVTIVSYYTNEKLVPWTNHVSNNLIRQAVLKQPPPDIAQNIFFREQGDRYFYIKEVDSKKKEMRNIIIYEISRNFPRVILSQKAIWKNKIWTLHDGMVHHYDREGEITYSAKFKTMDINVDREIRSFYEGQKTSMEMSSQELKEKIKTLKKGGVKTTALVVDYFMKTSTSGANLIFGIIGIAFCLTFVQSGKDWWGVVIAVIISVLAVGFYFFVTASFRAIGRGGEIDPFLAAWMPNIIFGVVGGFVIIKQALFK